MRLMLLLCILLAAYGSSSARAASPWRSLGFDGKGFVAGSQSGAIQVRDGYLPSPGEGLAPAEDRLPDGTGAVALFCYQQRSGGKLKAHAPFVPMAGCAVTVTGNSLTLAARSDASGYLVLALPPGSYQLRLFGFSKAFTVQSGKSSLVSVRGGKRMVD